MIKLGTEERRARLAFRHHLVEPAPTVEQVAGDLVGLHSSDPSTVYLSGRARVEGFQVGDLERALYEDQVLVRMHGMRRTMFVVPQDLAAITQASCTKDLIAKERQRFISMIAAQNLAPEPESMLEDLEADILEALGRRGEATTGQLTKDVPDLGGKKIRYGQGTKWAGTLNVGARMLFLLALEGRVIRGRPLGSWLSSQYRWRLSKLDRASPADPPDARRQLVGRWLRTFGPGTASDIKWWTGWTVRLARTTLDELGAVEVELDAGIGYVMPDDLDPTEPPEPWVALLPGLDPTVMGWKERGWYLGNHQAELFDRNGNPGPTVWLDGRIVGGWAQHENRQVVFRVLERVGSEAEGRIEDEAERLTGWLGEVRVTPRFRTPLEKELAG